MAIISVLAGASAVALQGSGKATSIAADSSKIFTALSEARQLAISANTRTRFVIVTAASGNPADWQMGRYGILREVSDLPAGETPYFELVGRLGKLGTGVYFQRGNEYGTGVFDSGSQSSGKLTGSGNVEYAYIEFLPSGGTTGTSTGNIFQIGRGIAPDGAADKAQYAMLGVSQQTGRIRIERK